MGATLRTSKPVMFTTNQKPLLVVLGATGAGKSKLAVEIATRIGGEIISADAMQMYKGLDIVTNKVTNDELKMCQHHMIGFLSPKQQFTVVDFQHETLKIIDDIHSRRKLPILVGGTNYYVESILWNLLVSRKDQSSDLIETNDEYRKALSELSSSDLHKKLSKIDPERAAVLHPKDRRKVIRSLEVFHQTGKPISEHISNQRMQSGGSQIGGPLRFPNTCALWVQCDPTVLYKRVYKRVDKMLSRGLLGELSNFHKQFNEERLKDGLEAEYENGIFQSIGFKEFHQYLTTSAATDDDNEKMISEATERMKLSTWQYAKYQTKWIRKRILSRPVSIPVYGLNGSDPVLWDENVLNPALSIVKSFFSSHKSIISGLDVLPDNVDCPQPLEKVIFPENFERKQHKCSVCGGRTIHDSAWQGHLKSKRHKHNYGLWRKEVHGLSDVLCKRQNQLNDNGNIEPDCGEQSNKSADDKEFLCEDEPIMWDIFESDDDEKSNTVT